MSEAKKSWQEEEVDSIQRCPHDQENPYSQISNELIRDQSISPNCRWLIIYLLSNKGNWRIKIAQIINHLKEHVGRDKIYKIVEEAIDSGYIMREEYTYNNLKRCRYFVSEQPKFKKILRHPENQDTETLHPENQGNKEEHAKKEHLKKEYSKSSSSLPSSSNDDACGADDDLENKEIFYTKTTGQKAKLTQTQVYNHFLSKPFSTDIIKEAIRRFHNIISPVNNALKYLESICVTIEKESTSKTFNKKNKPVNIERPEKTKEKTITFEEYFRCLGKTNPFPSEKV